MWLLTVVSTFTVARAATKTKPLNVSLGTAAILSRPVAIKGYSCRYHNMMYFLFSTLKPTSRVRQRLFGRGYSSAQRELIAEQDIFTAIGLLLFMNVGPKKTLVRAPTKAIY